MQLKFVFTVVASLSLLGCAGPERGGQCTKETFGSQKVAFLSSVSISEWKPEEVRSLRRGAYQEIGSLGPSAMWRILDLDQSAIIEVSRTIGRPPSQQPVLKPGTIVRNGTAGGREWTDRVSRYTLSPHEQAELICSANNLWLDPRTRETNAIAFGVMRSVWLVSDGAYKEFSGTGVTPKPAEVFADRLAELMK